MGKRKRNRNRGTPEETPPRLSEPPPPATTPSFRTWSNVFIAAFLLFQLAMPLRYYLFREGDDERFSWRMFSSVRARSCSAQVYETLEESGAIKRVPLRTSLHAAWVGLLQRDRRPVVEKFLRSRCQDKSVREVRYVRRCRSVGEKATPPVEVWFDCGANAFRGAK